MKGMKLFVALGLLVLVGNSAMGKECSCPQCDASDKYCVAIPEKKEVTKKCYKVECKEICIPAIRFPWQKCCKPKCGKVISVRVLKKVDYKCTKCGYRWEIKGVKGCDAKGGCADKSCGAKVSLSDREAPPVAATRTKSAEPRRTKVTPVKFYDYFKK